MSTDFNPPPVFCPQCGHEVQHLFCLPCALSRLDSADLAANAREIRRLAKRPIGKLYAAADCAACSRPMATGERAHLLPRGVVVHVECVEQLIAQLDAAVPQREPTQPEDLPFEGEPLVVE
jgi:hypothetical protein